MSRGNTARKLGPAAHRRSWRTARPVLRPRARRSRPWWPIFLLVVAAAWVVWKFSPHPVLQRMHYPLLYPEIVSREAQRAGVPASLVAAVILHESEFRRRASSPVGARGLMQLMPETAQWVDQQLEGNQRRELDLYAPEVNVRLGAVYLGYLWERFQADEVACLAAYNAGPEVASEWLKATPDGYLMESDIQYPETREYVEAVRASERKYRELYPELKPLASR